MATDWSMAAVIVAILCIPLMMSPEASRRFGDILNRLRRLVQPSSGLCERLLWDDIPEGFLHTGTNDDRFSVKAADPISNIVATIFDRAWNSPSRRGKLARKPEGLSLSQSYLQTDRKTVLALVGMTSKPLFDFEEKKGVLLAKLNVAELLSPVVKDQCGSITKSEMNNYIQGYPPFHRATLQLPQGSSISYPIHDIEDIARAGWVIAVGLDPHSNARMRIYFSTDRTFPSKLYQLQALTRVERTLLDLFLPRFPEEKWNIRCAAAAADALSWTASSEYCTYLHEMDLHEKDKGVSLKYWTYGTITDEQSIVAIRVFNNFHPLEAADVDCLRPILRSLLILTVEACLRISRFYHRKSIAFEEPPMLRNHRYIYLRDDSSDDE